MDPAKLSDEALLDAYEESRREPGAALLAGCLAMVGGWAGLIIFLGLKGFLLAIIGTMAWAWVVQRVEAARQRELLVSPLPHLLCERGLSTACTFDYLVERARRGEDGATADRPIVVLKGTGLPHGRPVSVRVLLDRTAGTARLERDRTTRDLQPADVERLTRALDDFANDPSPGGSAVIDGFPCDVMVAGSAVHVSTCNLADNSVPKPVHRLAQLLTANCDIHNSPEL